MSKRMAWALSSIFLQYPNLEFEKEFNRYKELVAALPDAYKAPLSKFVSEVDSLTIEALQQHYVENFDMRRKFSLFLTSWTHGDTRNRGMAMVYFKEKYKRSNLILSDSELPDHLSVVLDYSAHHDSVEGELLLAEHHAPIQLIYASLANINSVYAYVLETIIATLPEITAEIEKRARDLAISGPPKEFVGLDGAVEVALQPFSFFDTRKSEGVLL